MRPDQSPDPSPDLLPAPIAYGAFFAPSERGDAAIALCAHTATHLTAESHIAFFSPDEFLAALRARFPGARVEMLEPVGDAHRAWVFVDDPASADCEQSALTPDEADLWDALYGGNPPSDEDPFAAGWDAACAAARGAADAARDSTRARPRCAAGSDAPRAGGRGQAGARLVHDRDAPGCGGCRRTAAGVHGGDRCAGRRGRAMRTLTITIKSRAACVEVEDRGVRPYGLFQDGVFVEVCRLPTVAATVPGESNKADIARQIAAQLDGAPLPLCIELRTPAGYRAYRYVAVAGARVMALSRYIEREARA